MKNKHRTMTCSANWQETCLRQWIRGDRIEQLSCGALLKRGAELFSDTLYDILPSGRDPDCQLSERTIPAGHNTVKAEIISLHNGTDSDCLQLLSTLGQLHKVCHQQQWYLFAWWSPAHRPGPHYSRQYTNVQQIGNPNVCKHQDRILLIISFTPQHLSYHMMASTCFLPRSYLQPKVRRSCCMQY